MIVEQLLKDIQRLIDRGTINPSAEIGIIGRIDVYDTDTSDSYLMDFETANLEIDIAESYYNKLLLISEPDDV